MSKSTTGRRRAGLASIATTALVAGACFAGAGAANADSSFDLGRIAGVDRYDTSTLVSDAYAATTPDVIFANGQQGNYADALTANYLSGAKNAPILLTKADATPDVVKTQLKDAGVKNIWIVGGETVVSAAQEAQLKADGYSVTRISGGATGDRFDTNAQVIETAGNAKGNLGIIATGFNFPDALGAGPLAYSGIPLGLVSKDTVDQDVIDALKGAGVSRVLVAGGEDAVSNAVVAKLAENGITLEKRFAGANRTDTSVQIAKWAIANASFKNSEVNVASGYTKGSGADALAGGPLSGQEMRPLLVTRNVTDPGAELLDFLKTNANTLTTGTIFGGYAAVSASAEDAMEAAARTVTSNQSYNVTGGGSKTVSTVAAPNQGAFQYTVSGLGTSPVDIQLFAPGNVKTDANGQTTFTSSGGANTAGNAVPGSPAGTITVVNGVPNASGDHSYSVTPTNGTVTFTVNSQNIGSAVPVVYSQADNNDTLEVNAAGAPTEAFGIGGQATWTAPAAGSGAFNGNATPTATGNVSSVDHPNHTFATSTFTYSYDANDTYTVDGHPATFATFDANINKGDTVSGNYSSDAAASSQFNLLNVAPANPANVAATATGNKVTVKFDDETTGTATSYNVYRATYSSPAVACGAFPNSTPAANTTAYKQVGTLADTDPTGQYSFTDAGLAAGNYCYVVTAVNPKDVESAGSTATPATATVVAPPAGAIAGAPVITSAKLADDTSVPGFVSAGDQWNLVFNEPIANSAGVVTGALTFKDAAGNTESFSCGTAAGDSTCTVNTSDDTTTTPGTTYKAGTLVTITVGININYVSGSATPGYPVTLTGISGFKDADEGLGANLANSTDKTVG